MQFKISYQILPERIYVEASQNETILESAQKAGVRISTSCGGNGTCGACLVYVEINVDKLASRNEIEQEMALDRNFKINERLACQTCPSDGLVISHIQLGKTK